MGKKKIAYIGVYTDESLEKVIPKYSFFAANLLRRFLGKPKLEKGELAPWNKALVKAFEADANYEYHIIAPKSLIKSSIFQLERNGIHYHFYRLETRVWSKFLKYGFNWFEKSDYKIYRKRIRTIINQIKPDLIVVCGAENPVYSSCALDKFEQPLLVLFQTLLNDAKRIQFAVGTEYRRKMEERIIKDNKIFGISETVQLEYVRKVNPTAEIFRFSFPIIVPLNSTEEKEFDFLFFASGITKFKGVEDAIKAFALVNKVYRYTTLSISGGCSDEYMKELVELVKSMDLSERIKFHGRFENQSELYSYITKAKVIVVPGITAELNSTVKESMLLGIPTICYETLQTELINKDTKCVFTASMQDIDDLAAVMTYVISNPDSSTQVAQAGKEYALGHFTPAACARLLNSEFDNVIISH